ncbi:MAG: cytochrome P450 [Myxococcota bacterium]
MDRDPVICRRTTSERSMSTVPAAVPRPQAHPLGVLLRTSRDVLGTLRALHDECGDVAFVDLPFVPTLIFAHPEAIHTVLVKDFRSYRKDNLTRQLRRILGDGLLTAEGERWRRHRRLAQPGFHHEAIQGYADVMVRTADAVTGAWGERTELDVHHEMMRLTLDIVSRTLFGHDIGADAALVADRLDRLMDTSRGVANTGFLLPQWVPSRQNARHASAVADLDRVVYRIIEAHRRQPDQRTLLGMLLAATDAEGGLTDVELRDEAITLLMAGHETTAAALTFALYLLSQHPNAEAELHAELDALPAAPGLADLPRLPYTRAVVLEAMRLYPPAWSVGREALVDTAVGDVPVPRGTQVWLSPWLTQRDPRWFDAPEAFVPERWLGGELERALPDGAYFPFSAGPRVCIGKRFAELEAVLVLAAIGRRYALRLRPGETLRLDTAVTLRPRGGLAMTATARAAVRHAA